MMTVNCVPERKEILQLEPRQLQYDVVSVVSILSILRSIVIDESNYPSPIALNIIRNGANIRCANGSLEGFGVLSSFSMTALTLKGSVFVS